MQKKCLQAVWQRAVLTLGSRLDCCRNAPVCQPGMLSRVDTVDTTCAGDTFMGTSPFQASGQLEGHDIKQALIVTAKATRHLPTQGWRSAVIQRISR